MNVRTILRTAPRLQTSGLPVRKPVLLLSGREIFPRIIARTIHTAFRTLEHSTAIQPAYRPVKHVRLKREKSTLGDSLDCLLVRNRLGEDFSS